jgi:phospholipase/carboxylesterase
MSCLRTGILSIVISISTINKPSLTYLVREPKVSVDKPPLLILLHGVGSNEKDLFSFAPYLPNKFLVISARAPIVLGPSSFAWYQVDFSSGKPVYNQEQERKSREMILTFIEELKELHSFDENEVYLMGFSQGAIMSYSIALTHPEKIKAIGILSGRLLEEIKPFVNAGQVNKLNIFISHGIQDPVLPITYSEDAVSYLKSLGLNSNYKKYNEGHGIKQEMLNDFINWLNNTN